MAAFQESAPWAPSVNGVPCAPSAFAHMTAMAGECADGIRLQLVVTTKYIDEEVLPNLARGAARAGRDVDEVEVCLKPLIGTAPD